MNIPNWFYDERVQQNLMFSKDEFELIFKIMKEGKSVEEQQKMDETLQKARQVFSGKR